MNTMEDLAEWCVDHEYLLMVEYHGKVRMLNPLATFTTQAQERRLSAFDSTHPTEETPRTYKFEDMTLLGITRIRERAVTLVAQTQQSPAERPENQGADGAKSQDRSRSILGAQRLRRG